MRHEYVAHPVTAIAYVVATDQAHGHVLIAAAAVVISQVTARPSAGVLTVAVVPQTDFHSLIAVAAVDVVCRVAAHPSAVALAVAAVRQTDFHSLTAVAAAVVPVGIVAGLVGDATPHEEVPHEEALDAEGRFELRVGAGVAEGAVESCRLQP